jgi:hypothetical protein
MFQVHPELGPHGPEYLSPAITEGRVGDDYFSLNHFLEDLDDEASSVAASTSFIEADAHVGQLDSCASLPGSFFRDIDSFVRERIHEPLTSQQQLPFANMGGAFTFKW